MARGSEGFRGTGHRSEKMALEGVSEFLRTTLCSRLGVEEWKTDRKIFKLRVDANVTSTTKKAMKARACVSGRVRYVPRTRPLSKSRQRPT
jgi:hypothetical protein